MATRRAKPALASQAEKAKRSMGVEEGVMEVNSRVHKEIARKSESIIPSKHKRAERRWAR